MWNKSAWIPKSNESITPVMCNSYITVYIGRDVSIWDKNKVKDVNIVNSGKSFL